jgi:hypothetical protein
VRETHYARLEQGWVEINGGNKTGMMLMRGRPRSAAAACFMARARNLRVNSHSAALSRTKMDRKSFIFISPPVCSGAKLPHLWEVKAHVADGRVANRNLGGDEIFYLRISKDKILNLLAFKHIIFFI